MRESLLSPLLQNRACEFPSTRLLSYSSLVMGTSHLRGHLVMAVSMDEQKIAFLTIRMVSIHMMDLSYVLLSQVELAIAACAFLLCEQSGSPWGEYRTAPEPGCPVGPVSIIGGPASLDLDVSDDLHRTMLDELFAFFGCKGPLSFPYFLAGLLQLPLRPTALFLRPVTALPEHHTVGLLERFRCDTGSGIIAPSHSLGMALPSDRFLGSAPHVSDHYSDRLQMSVSLVLFRRSASLQLPFCPPVLSTVEAQDVDTRLISFLTSQGVDYAGFLSLQLQPPLAYP